jgi:cell wall assembly regulator SMI1
MSSDAPLLVSESQLDALERELADQQAVVVAHLRPGLSDDEMDELCAPFGLVLPVEARLWYAWHDGAEGEGQYLGRSISGWRPMPLRMAIADIEQTRRTDAEVQATLPPEHRWDPDWKWAAHWLPFARPGHGARLGLDCGVPPDAPSPVYYVEWINPIEGPPTPRHPSLGDLIEDWLHRLCSGDWRFDTDTSRWHLMT